MVRFEVVDLFSEDNGPEGFAAEFNGGSQPWSRETLEF